MFLEATTVLGQRLETHVRRPVVVAFSGGGDSLALLLIAKAWAEGAGRQLIAATVDHRLQPAGAEWAIWCAARAARLGVQHRVLVWDAPKPSTGLPAAARKARHALLADLAHAEGSGVILMGHTADDVLEAAAMRAAGSTTPSPRQWTPSPAWPQGRDVFLLRPLLNVRRSARRDWLALRGETWIEDPANGDHRFARARARHDLSRDAGPPSASATLPRSMRHAEAVTFECGDLRIPREAFARPDAEARGLLTALLLCAAGGDRSPRGPSLDRLLSGLGGREHLVATLAGARVEAAGEQVRVAREPGELRRQGVGELALTPGAPAVWDGRFEVTTDREGLAVRPLAGLSSRLAKDEAAALRAVHPAVRRGLPALVDPDGEVTCPILAGGGLEGVRSLIEGRFLAASGAIQDEAAIWRVAKAGRTS